MPVDGKTVLFKNIREKKPSVGSFILGVGEVHQSTEGGSASLKVDVTPQKAAQSFAPLEKRLGNELFNKIKEFYQKDHNVYRMPMEENFRFDQKKTNPIERNSLVFKIFVETTALGKSSFTYLYKYKFSFNDGNFEIHSTNFLSSLDKDINDFRTELVEKCNRFISGSNKRKVSDLNLTGFSRLVSDYDLGSIQKYAPVLSCVKGKFDLANVDLEDIRRKTLWNRSKNMDGTDNEEVFQKYCDGICDEEIRASYGFSNVDLFAEKHFGKFGMWGAGAFKAVVSGFVYWKASVDIPGGPMLSVGVANDLCTIRHQRDLLHTTSLSDSIITMAKMRSDSWAAKTLKVIDSAFNNILAVLDFGANVYYKATGDNRYSESTGLAGGIYQGLASMMDTINRGIGNKSIPQAIYDLTEMDMLKYCFSDSRKPDVSGWTDMEGNEIMNYNTDGSFRGRICTESLMDSDFGVEEASFGTKGAGRYGGHKRKK